jgi:hypothetical protein
MTARCYPILGMRQLCLLPMVALLASCGPIQSGALIVDAAAELSAAQTSQGDKHSPFEFVAAEEYLHKAREEQSYAEFERAVDFAKKSRDCARVARSRAEAAMRKEIAGEAAAAMPGPTTKARCRPGPERLRPMLDPDQEPAAQPIAEPTTPQPVKKQPAKAAPKKDEPKDPPPAERTVVKPKEETPALPEGDE